MRRRTEANRAALRALLRARGDEAMLDLSEALGALRLLEPADVVRLHIDWGEICPCAAAAYHWEWMAQLPRWRIFARARHRREALRYRGRCRKLDTVQD